MVNACIDQVDVFAVGAAGAAGGDGKGALGSLGGWKDVSRGSKNSGARGTERERRVVATGKHLGGGVKIRLVVRMVRHGAFSVAPWARSKVRSAESSARRKASYRLRRDLFNMAGQNTLTFTDQT